MSVVSRTMPAILRRADHDLDLCGAKILAISSTIVGIRLATSVTTNSPQNCFSILFQHSLRPGWIPFLNFFLKMVGSSSKPAAIWWFTIKIAPGDFDPCEHGLLMPATLLITSHERVTPECFSVSMTWLSNNMGY
jgi:hypothetical protein